MDAADRERSEIAAPVVEVQQVCKRFVRTWALRYVDLQVGRGELVGLLGANGSGKSTLLRIICSALRPTYGEVKVLGAPPRKNGALRSIGVLSQHSYLYGELTARENLRFAASMYGLDGMTDADLEGALQGVGLRHVADDQVRTFSSGMRKRLSLARATLHDPKLVLLDEPYGSLDVEGIEWVDRFVTGLKQADKTAIIATHEVGRARMLCDRAVVLRSGGVIYDGPARDFEPSWGGETGVPVG